MSRETDISPQNKDETMTNSTNSPVGKRNTVTCCECDEPRVTDYDGFGLCGKHASKWLASFKRAEGEALETLKAYQRGDIDRPTPKEKTMRSLEQYLDDNAPEIIDFAFRAGRVPTGMVITVHPDSKNGETVDYYVRGNELVSLYEARNSDVTKECPSNE